MNNNKSYKLALISVFIALVASAGWEDPHMPTRRPVRGDRQTIAPTTSARPANTVSRPVVTQPTAQPISRPVAQPVSQPAPRQVVQPVSQPAARRQVPVAPAPVVRENYLQPAPVVPSSNSGIEFTDLYSVFLDSDNSSHLIYGFNYLGAGDTVGEESFSSLELAIQYRFAEFRNFLGSDLTLSLNPLFTIIMDDSGIDDIPGFLVNLPLDVQFVWRFVNKWSFELGAAPGFYGDIEAIGGNMFACPFRGILYYSLEPELSFMAGGEVRIGWDQTVMPYVGLAWQPSDMFLLELAMPRSLIKTQLGPIGLYGVFEWNNTTYALDDENESKLEDLTISDCRFGVGTIIDFTEDFSLTLEGGLVENREVVGEGDDAEGVLEVDGSFYFGVSIGSRF